MERQAAVSAPLLALAMKEGHIRRQDPVALAHWLARISLICLFSPPPGDLVSALDALLLPALEPDGPRRRDTSHRTQPPHNPRSVTMFDIVIRGGTIVDGTGAAPFAGDVAIDGDTIVEVGSVDGRGRREIDADGAVVTPGFLDLHTHYDGQVTWDDALEPSATNGITTIVLGNCGVGFAPVRPTDHESAHRHDGRGRGHPRLGARRSGCRGASGSPSPTTST